MIITPDFMLYAEHPQSETDLMIPLVAQLSKLTTLGGAQQIRGYFLMEGIQGVPRDLTECPLWHYLTREMELSGCYVDVRTMGTRLGRIGESPLGMVYHSPEILKFLNDFNGGRYPELCKEATVVNKIPCPTCGGKGAVNTGSNLQVIDGTYRYVDLYEDCNACGTSGQLVQDEQPPSDSGAGWWGGGRGRK